MITRLKISGFKSFHNFQIEFTPFTLIAGINATGKSNLFDALHLLSRLADTDLKSAFGEQRGEPSELFTQYDKDHSATEMSFDIEFLVNKKVKDNWGGEAELKYTRLRYQLTIERSKDARGFDTLYVKDERLENLKHDEDKWVKNYIPPEFLEHWRPKVTSGRRTIPYLYKQETEKGFAFKIPQDGRQGGKETPANAVGQTALSSINSVDYPHAFAVRQEMRGWNFLHLSPEDLRQPTRKEPNISDRITQTGKNLAAALYRIQLDDEFAITEISKTLNCFLPNFIRAQAYDDDANRQFIIKLAETDGREFTTRTLSEGTLRLLTLITLLHDPLHTGLLCFEEPENGIHPTLIKSALELLVNLSVDFSNTELPLRQVIVNTHSPLFVRRCNKWKDDKRAGVWFCQYVTLIEEVEGRRMKLGCTKMLPVSKSWQNSIDYSELEKKWSLHTLEEYLQTAAVTDGEEKG